VEAATALPLEERVAVFDNGAKPMPIELAFIMQRLAEMATRDFG
jgi:hypothetical protein